jgi:hypothetical protein
MWYREGDRSNSGPHSGRIGWGRRQARVTHPIRGAKRRRGTDLKAEAKLGAFLPPEPGTQSVSRFRSADWTTPPSCEHNEDEKMAVEMEHGPVSAK